MLFLDGLEVSLQWNDIEKFLSSLQTTNQGADTILYAALSPTLEGRGGVYLDNCCEIQSNSASYNKADAKRLWEVTQHLTSIKDKWTNWECVSQ